MKKIGLVWLHHDLRIHDHAALANASKQCEQLLVLYATYTIPPHRGQAYHHNGLGAHRKRFLQESLADLACSLKSLGNHLVFIENATLAQIKSLITTHNVTDIYHSQTADYDQQWRLDSLSMQLMEVKWHSYSSETLFDELPLLTLPKVFTSFRQTVEKDRFLLRSSAPIAQTPTPERLPPVPDVLDTALLYSEAQPRPLPETFIGGETQALLQLQQYFSSEAPSSYKDTRNALDGWAESTKFSAWLANGSLSVRTLLSALRDYEKNTVQNDSTYWIWFELLWREYFHWYAQEHGKKLFTFKGITPCKRMSCFYGERYERWKQGNTPYPIINACMNQLRETGYLSNRGRQLVASCFVNELGMDWRYGATYFEQQLIDYDVASNWGNWQYIAGVGADPRGGRQFNLEKQTAQYDPDGQFIAKWRGDSGATQIDSVDAADWPIV